MVGGAYGEVVALLHPAERGHVRPLARRLLGVGVGVGAGAGAGAGVGVGWGLVGQNPDIPSTLLHVHSYQQRALHRHTRDGALLSRASSAPLPPREYFFQNDHAPLGCQARM